MERLPIYGYSVVETNSLKAIKSGEMQAQLPLGPNAQLIGAQNGQLLAVDLVNKVIDFPSAATDYVWLHASEEQLYQAHQGRKHFILRGNKYARMFKLTPGDIFETNAVAATLEPTYPEETEVNEGEAVEGATLVPDTRVSAGDLTITGVTVAATEDGVVDISFGAVEWPVSQTIDPLLGLNEDFIYIDFEVAAPATATKIKIGEDLIEFDGIIPGTTASGVLQYIPVAQAYDGGFEHFANSGTWIFNYEWYNASDILVATETLTVTRPAKTLAPKMVTWEDVKALAKYGIPTLYGDIELVRSPVGTEKVVLKVVEWVTLPGGSAGVKFSVDVA